MPPFQPMPAPRNATIRHGFALLIVLGCVTLLSLALAVLLALTRSERVASKSSAEIRRVDLLSEAAFDTLVEDLRREIRDGSLNAPSHTAGEPAVSRFIPKAPETSVPNRTVTEAVPDPAAAAPFLAHYLKASQSAVPFYSGTNYAQPGPVRASAVSTTAPALNGRSIRRERWNSHQLFGANLPTDFHPPDWVYITRKHVGQTEAGTAIDDARIGVLRDAGETNPDFIVGRFAYAIHDLGARLDINVAGNSLPASAQAKKGLLHQAGLSAIPGILKPDDFLQWRSKWSAGKGGDAPNELFDPRRDFIAVPNGDQTFVSRGDLIDYAKNHPDILSTAALPYLTTFSRELNAPSFRPKNPAGPHYRTTYDYATNADTPPAFSAASTAHPKGYNPDLANARNSVGQPAIRRRFPLSRLSWLTKDGPAPGKEADIKKYFGLVWSAADLCWDYTGPDDESRASFVKRLDQLPAEREPDFFELLMAGILEGSLGVDTDHCMGGQNAAKYQNPCLQAVQIGACIIDQANEGSIPTQIRINNGEQAGTPAYSLFGVKNLPYLHGFTVKMYRPSPSAGNTSTRDYLYTWLIPELWNPFGNAATHPGWKFRMRIVSGQSQGWVIQVVPDPIILPDGTETYRKNIMGDSVTIGSPDRSIEWEGETDFSDLTLPTASNSRYAGSPGDASCLRYSDFADGSTRIIGFCIARIFVPDKNLTGIARDGYTLDAKPFYVPSGTGLTMDLQVNDGSGWRTYWQMEAGDRFRDDGRLQCRAIGCAAQSPPSPPTPETPYFVFPDVGFRILAVDPLSPRFGFTGLAFNALNKGDWFAWQDLKSYRPTAIASGGLSAGVQTLAYGPEKNAFSSTPGDLIYGDLPKIKSYLGRLPQNLPSDEPGLSVPGSKQNPWFYMVDADGIARFGDGFLGVSNASGNPLGQGTGSDPAVRPFLLNRPFRSVGELGYVYRGLPWKTLDFSTSRSADSALLDLFCMTESEAEHPVVGGRISANTQIPEVLTAMLSGVERTENATGGVAPAMAATLAKKIIAEGTSARGPYLNRADVVTRLGAVTQSTSSTTYPVYKIQREAVARALEESMQTRTWNLLIDLIAQVGRLPPGSAKLESFQVTGEQHYWIQLAIDRYTGEVIDRRVEIVAQ